MNVWKNFRKMTRDSMSIWARATAIQRYRKLGWKL